jgi:UDP-N-acetylmuramate-alanine ligase
MSSSPSQPLDGRRIWIAGIGGAGMSAYALLAHAWGAEVAGWDRVATPYLAHLEGIDVTIAPEPPRPPDGWEAYVSTAYAGRVQGRPEPSSSRSSCRFAARSSSLARTARRRRPG